MSIMSTRSARRLATALTVGATAAALALGPGSPALAATPAVKGQAQAQTTFDADTGDCTLVHPDPSNTQIVTVPTTGTKKFSRSASATGSAVSTGDPTDSVTMKATNTVTGSVTGAGGAFSKMSATMTQSAKITMSKGFGSDCDPQIVTGGTAAALAHVKKAGTITMRITVPPSGLGEMIIQGTSGPGSVVVSYLHKGTHTVTQKVKPGDYQIIGILQTPTEFAPPLYSLESSGRATFSATYKAS